MVGEHTLQYLQDAVQAEQEHGDSLHGKFHNHHEALGVLKEEVEELQEAAASFQSGVDSEIQALWKLIRKDRVEDLHRKISHGFARMRYRLPKRRFRSQRCVTNGKI